jgi:predicted NAD/FAD-dependent oxidoreductase
MALVIWSTTAIACSSSLMPGVGREILTPWQPQTFDLTADGSLQARATRQPYLVAPAGMNVIGKQLAQGLTIHRQQRLLGLALTAAQNLATHRRPRG